MTEKMKDRFGRKIEYMRISITDRCNLRCRYCMPSEGIDKISMKDILTYEEIAAVCEEAVSLGIDRFRITGGEPLVRKGCADLVRLIKRIPKVEQVNLTTNGQLLGEQLDGLVRAGIDGVNISIDSLDSDRYRYITRGGELGPVLDSIETAVKKRVHVKINCLLAADTWENEAVGFARLAFDKGIAVRFIETMPVGLGRPEDGVANSLVLDMLKKKLPDMVKDTTCRGNGPAVYYRIPGSKGAVGFISALGERFCGSCNRIRLTSTGRILPCLSYDDNIDIKSAIRSGSKEDIRRCIMEGIEAKPSGHCFGAEGSRVAEGSRGPEEFCDRSSKGEPMNKIGG